MQPEILCGNHNKDERGKLSFNNDFDFSAIKRIYFIENKNTNFVRAWQGHQKEQRWFSVVEGSFVIKIIKIDNWKIPQKNLEIKEFSLNSENFDILHLPGGYITSIQAKSENSKLMVMSDFLLGEIDDEYRFPPDYFQERS